MSRSAADRAGRDSERRLVDWLRRHADPDIGDDCALWTARGAQAVTVDAQHEGVHLPPGLDPRLAARRLLAVNLSDLAAVGARPAAAFLSLAAPPDYERRRFLRGLVEACREHDVVLRGGDLSRLPRLSATLTVIGTRRPGSRWLRRAAARPGDSLWVGGALGVAAAGLALLSTIECPPRGMPTPAGIPPPLRRAAAQALRRQLQPKPQISLGSELAGRSRVAAIDCSDGLGLDLARLCEASGVGAEVEISALPLPHPGLCAELGLDPVELALGGGEDYVLIFSLPPRSRPPRTVRARRVGRFTANREVVAIDPDGRRRDIATLGFDHLRG